MSGAVAEVETATDVIQHHRRIVSDARVIRSAGKELMAEVRFGWLYTMTAWRC